MTTVIRTRHPLQVISMSNEQPERRKSKRLAASSVYDEQDGDFHFTRGSKSKRVKNAESEPEPEPESEPAPLPPKKSGRGRPAKGRASVATKAPEPASPVAAPKAATSSKPRTRRAASLQPAEDDELQLFAPKRTTNRSTRSSTGKAQKAKPARKPAPEPVQEEEEEAHDEVHSATPRELEPNRRRTQPAMEEPVESAKITLPVSDTPVINRNKEMRKKGGVNRRSSTGMRGRRASSLIESGHNAIPHREVDSAEFYKHIESEGLMEPRRMKQLLTWCGERALLQKPPHGQTDSNTILGARYIQEQLLKDFSTKSEFSDWFSREEERPKKPIVYLPNPRNLELQEKIEQQEQKVKRLKQEKKKWLALNKTRPEIPPLFPETDTAQTATADASILEPNEAEMLSWLTDPASSFENVRAKALARLQNTQSTLEFKVDQLADGIHKLSQRVDTAGREADKVLSLSAARLKEREVREKATAGTKEMPVMEVLRSLGRILPEGGE
ncbi:Mis12-Mtw1 protein family-domain-containing protein [Colletotrichum godetiae]|uniref:Mis12-Mtw1 protein family-domain-containing protein n=1 Tax=Colletotrichum godetiae TaxID=1209918 RepID=A0AAJ0AXY7_9PEZI|nr:Mis12-Mtw1 protein family-domain-containing protein [Colletotrichum godetiae]KAK1700356.1 Mis12-Mtw1 protein family-domain-containing protein [Colletotrichum godetiae]